MRRAARGNEHVRARCMEAVQVRRLRLAAGAEDEESLEAEVGALLDAETAAEIHGLHRMVESYVEALNRK